MFDPTLEPLLSDDEMLAVTEAEFAAREEADWEDRMIPAGLDEWAPGPFLAAVLSSIDPSQLNGHDAIVVMKAHARQVSHYQAGYYRSIGEVATAVPTGEHGPPQRSEEWFEFTNLELRASLTLTRRAADAEIDFAHELIERLPSVWAALDSGDIDLRKAREIVRGTAHLDDGSARGVVERVIKQAPAITKGQLGTRIRRLCIEVNPEEAKQRTEEAFEDRRMIIEPTVDGTADFHAYGAPIDRAAAIGRKINALARNLKNADDSRTMDHLRMDVFLDLLEGNYTDSYQARSGSVDIHVDLETLAELSESPGELAGFGPVIADIARQVASRQTNSEWRTTVTNESGQIVHTGTTRRRPTTALKRQILANYPTCVFPGCQMPANACDIDHLTPWSEGGATSFENNAPLCRHDHVGRHMAGWTYKKLKDSRHLWTSRLGHLYVTGGRPP